MLISIAIGRQGEPPYYHNIIIPNQNNEMPIYEYSSRVYGTQPSMGTVVPGSDDNKAISDVILQNPCQGNEMTRKENRR